MLMLHCVQFVQTNQKNLVQKRKKQLSNLDKQKIYELAKKAKTLNLKNLIDKIHKLIIKELRSNENCNIKKW
jgi:hypothetical protein